MSLSNTERELTALGISAAAGCKPCTVHHLRAAREVGVTDEEMKDAVAVALSVRNHATELMERFFLTRLGPRRRSDRGRPAPPDPSGRVGLLVSLGVAHAVNCTSSLRRLRETAVAAGIPHGDIDTVLELARHIKGRGAYHVEKYAPPTTDERVFLFLDLIDSTGTAERLGHEDYSRLIRACYRDLTDLVIRYRAEIYQYVGDEVVLSWSLADGFEDANCVRILFAFLDKLAARRKEYEASFGIQPSFRGGMDMGPVTRADVGGVSPEIAYHGDVLNTASRILELAKAHHEPLLISERVRDAVQSVPEVGTRFVADVVPRGKSERLRVHSVEPIPSPSRASGLVES
jgi:AhpD family alkylhydroperoxidase